MCVKVTRARVTNEVEVSIRGVTTTVLLLLATTAPVPTAAAEPGRAWQPAAADWPTIFGNFQNTGSVEDPKFAPPFRLKWATRLEGQMKSSPVVGDGRIFAQTVNGMILAMDSRTGRVLWRNFYPGVLPNKGAQNRNSPLYIDGRLYYSYFPGGLYCVAAATGKELWRHDEGVRSSKSRFSPLWHDGLIFFPYWVKGERQGKHFRYVVFNALDAVTGKEAWRKEFTEFSSPDSVLAPFPPVSSGCIGDGTLFVSLGAVDARRQTSGVLMAIEPATGRELWRNEQNYARGSLAYVAYHDRQLFVGGTGSPFRCLDAQNGSTVWEVSAGPKGSFGAAISSRGVALRSYGPKAFLLDRFTGKPLLGPDGKAVQFGYAGSTGCSPLTIVNERYGIQQSGGESRRLAVARIDTGETLWHFQLTSRACPGSVISEGRIYTPSNGDGLLYCFEHDDGALPPAVNWPSASGPAPVVPPIGPHDWPQFKFNGARTGHVPGQSISTPLEVTVRVQLDAPALASPAVMAGRVFVLDEDGTAYAIDPTTQSILWKRQTGGVNNRSSPVAIGDRVYFGSTNGNFYVLNANDGSLFRQVAMPQAVLCSPALSESGRLYVHSLDGTLIAMDLDAQVRWSFKLRPSQRWWLADQEICQAPHDVAVKGHEVLAVAGNVLFKLRDDGYRGTLLWEHPSGGWASGASLLGDDLWIGNAPQEMENQVLQSTLDNAITARQSGPNGDRKGAAVQAVWGVGRVNTPPSVSVTRACFGSLRDGFWCVDLTGTPRDKWASAPLRWSTASKVRNTVTGATGFVGAAAITAEHCVFGGLDGSLYAIRLDATGSELSRIQPPPDVIPSPDKSMILSTPAISNGVVYVTTSAGLLLGLSHRENQ